LREPARPSFLKELDHGNDRTKIGTLGNSETFTQYLFLTSFVKQHDKFHKISLVVSFSSINLQLVLLKIFANVLLQPETFYKSIAEQIKFERMKKKVSQQDLADHLNLSRTSIINIETGRHRPSLYQVIQIAAFLNIDYVAFIPYQFKKPDNTVPGSSVELKDGLTDEGTTEELDPSSQTAINRFLTDLK
jgi:transcriptional regulator with XRE-family HTH domain